MMFNKMRMKKGRILKRMLEMHVTWINEDKMDTWMIDEDEMSEILNLGIILGELLEQTPTS